MSRFRESRVCRRLVQLGVVVTLLVGLCLPGGAGPASAAERTLVLEFLDIPCPGHVATILEGAKLVQGVRQAEVDFDASRGVFAYDDAETDAAAIVAGMPHDCPSRILCDGACPEASGERPSRASD